MSITTSGTDTLDYVYSFYRLEGNRAVYIGPDHSDLTKDQLILNSVAPRQNKDTYGNRRTTLNMIQSVKVAAPNVDGEVSRDTKLETQASIPVGTDFAAFKEIATRQANLLLDETFVQALFVLGQVDHHQ